MTAGKVKSIEKTQKAQESSSPSRAFARQPSVAISPGTFDAALVPQVAGNLAVQQLFLSGAIQAKLAISQPGDAYEGEADRVAQQVVSMLAPSSVQRQTPGEDEVAQTNTPLVQRAPSDPLGSLEPGADFESRLSTSGGGSPLPASTRAFMEPRFGADFSEVRLHTGSEATQLNRAVSAQAFTHGRDIYLGEGKNNLESSTGKQLLAHELTHVVQQSGFDGFRAGQNNGKRGLSPISHEQAPRRARDVLPARPEGRHELSHVAASAALDLELQRMAGNRVITGLLQRQPTAMPPGPAAAPSGQPVGDAVQPEVESLLKTFASTSGEAQNAAAMQAVRAIIRAYSMSTKGLRTMRFNPDLKASADATTSRPDDNERESLVDFGPGSFAKGFAHLVHVVAHELEHVSQALIGGYGGAEAVPVKEFLAYTSSVLQVQSVAAPASRGFLGAQMMGADQSAPALPPLPPDDLGHMAEMALAKFSEMPSAEQKKPQYRQKLAAAGNKLLDRLKNEAPPLLRPPTKYTPEWTRWYEGQAPTLDILTPEYQDWQDSLKSPWVRVKAIWKQYDAAFRVR